MSQQYYSDIYLSLSQLLALLLQADAILLLNINVLVIRYHSQYRYATDILQYFTPLVKQPHVTTELIDDNTFDKLSVLRCLQHDAAIDAGKDAAAVDVAHQYDVGLGMTRH